MDDLISRQAAIDAVKKCRNESDMPDMWYDGMSCALRCIYQLSSSQPKSYREGYQAGFNEGYQAGFKDAQLEQQWIPCSERLPEEAGWYIASGVRDVGNRWYSTLHGWEETTFRVVAWMPLPEPAKL